MHILTEEELRMRQYHKNLHNMTKEEKEQEQKKARDLVLQLAKQRKERDMKLKVMHEQHMKHMEEIRQEELRQYLLKREADVEAKRNAIRDRMLEKEKRMQQEREILHKP